MVQCVESPEFLVGHPAYERLRQDSLSPNAFHVLVELHGDRSGPRLFTLHPNHRTRSTVLVGTVSQIDVHLALHYSQKGIRVSDANAKVIAYIGEDAVQCVWTRDPNGNRLGRRLMIAGYGSLERAEDLVWQKRESLGSLYRQLDGVPLTRRSQSER